MSDNEMRGEHEPDAAVEAGNALSDGWAAFRSRLKDFLIVAIGTGLAYGLIIGLIVLLVFRASDADKAGGTSSGAFGVAIGGLVLSGVLLLVTSIFVAAIQSRLALAAVDGDPAILGKLGRQALSRIGPFFGWGLLAMLMIIVGMVLCILPGLVVAFFLVFWPFIVIEGRLRGNPIAESFKAVKERAGELLLTYIVICGLSILVSGVSMVVQGIPVLGAIVQGVLTFLMSGFAVCTYAAIYRSTSLGSLAAAGPEGADEAAL